MARLPHPSPRGRDRCARETTTHDGIDADVVDNDLVESAIQLTYSDDDVMAERGDGGPDRIEEAFTVDGQSIDLQLERNERTFMFRVIADGEEVARIEVDDADWNLLHA